MVAPANLLPLLTELELQALMTVQVLVVQAVESTVPVEQLVSVTGHVLPVSGAITMLGIARTGFRSKLTLVRQAPMLQPAKIPIVTKSPLAAPAPTPTA